jgi:Xaa-Pro aminopeptidase
MFEKKLKEIRQKLIKEKLDAVLVSSVSNISYLTGFTNFSKEEREAYIFIGSDFAYVITDARYSEAVKKQVPHLTLFERGYKNPTKNLFNKHQKEIKKLGIEEDNLTVVEHKSLKKHFKNIKHFEVSHLRSIKNEDEISKIEKACRVGDLAFAHILKKITDGITEKWLAGELEKFIKEKDGEFSFPPIVAFGKNSSVPHHQTGNTKLTGNGEFTAKQEACFVLLDFGVKLDNYCSDMTRTIFFGKPSDKQKEIYQTVLAAQQKAVECINLTIKAGKQVKAAEVDQVARKYIVSKGYPAIPHSLGHGIGLEVHERPSLSPRSKEDLKEGMVFSIEPGIYLEGFGGVRIEDLYIYQNKKLRQLTKSPKEIIQI